MRAILDLVERTHDRLCTGNATLGNSALNSLTVNAKLQGATPLIFEGATVNNFRTNLAVTDPTSPRTITLPDASGQVVLTGQTGVIDSTMILDGTIQGVDLSSSISVSTTGSVQAGHFATGSSASSSSISGVTLTNS